MNTEDSQKPITNIFAAGETDEKKKKQLTDQEINDKYRKGEMRIVTEQGRIDIFTIHQMLNPPKSENGQEHKKYKLNPEYQRRKRWNNGKKSRLIESLIINVPLPPIFLYEVRYGEYEVIDGLQRLTTINEFYENNFKLTGLEYWKELEGRTYATLPKDIRAGIDRRYLSTVVLLEESAKTKRDASLMKRIVFERLNSGGEQLTHQEMRNALYDGKFNQLCIELAKNEKFRTIWRFPQESEVEELLSKSEEELSELDPSASAIEAYRRMEDIQLVLRFFAYLHIEEFKGYVNISNFLTDVLKRSNELLSEQDIANLKDLFEKTINLVYDIMGKEAFYIPKNIKQKTRKKPTKIVYDGVMQAFAKYIQYADTFIAQKDAIKQALYQDNKLLKSSKILDGRYNNWSDVVERIDYFDNILKTFIPNT